MGNRLSRHHRNRDYQQPAPSSSVAASVSTSQAHEDDGSIQSHTHRSESTVPENKESLTILTYQDQLTNAISANSINIAGVLREYDFISDEVSGKILRPSSSPQEKATILVNAVREKIKTVPKRLPELMRVFSEQVSTKDITEMLQIAYRSKFTVFIGTSQTIIHFPGYILY